MYDFKTWLTGLGVNVPDGRLDGLAQKLEVELQWRVGNEIAEHLSEQQLDEFEQLNQTGDQQATVKWLTTNYPDFVAVTERQLQRLQAELTNATDAVALIDFWPARS